MSSVSSATSTSSSSFGSLPSIPFIAAATCGLVYGGLKVRNFIRAKRRREEIQEWKERLTVAGYETNKDNNSNEGESAPDSSLLSDRACYINKNDCTPLYIANHFVRLLNPEKYPEYDSVHHPNGYICVSIAENKSNWRLLEPYLSHRPGMGVVQTGYNNFNGMTYVRDAVSSFFSRYIAGRTIQLESILMTAGANLAIDSLFWTIANPGEYCLLAKPYYAAFQWDLGLKSGVLIHEVETDVEHNFKFDLNAYKTALKTARAEGKVVRAVLICNPHNPLGTILSRQELESLVEWVKSEPGLHLVSDEIYALSVFKHMQPSDSTTDSASSPASYPSLDSASTISSPAKSPFVSLANVLPSLGERFHIIWSISKDFGLSGFRCGLALSENKLVQQAYNQLGQFNGLSTDVQHFVSLLFTNDDILVPYLHTMQRRLCECVTMMERELRSANIPFIPPAGTLFMWIDLRQWLRQPTVEGELELYTDILNECNVNMTPGSGFHSPVPGWFRFVHSAAEYSVIQVAIKRIISFLNEQSRQ